MIPYYKRDYEECKFNIPNYEIGFKIVYHKQGDIYKGNEPLYHSILFMLEGEILFSYNEYLNNRFTSGDMFLLPQSAEIYSRALTDCKILILSFNNEMESYCDYCIMSLYRKNDSNMKYEFVALKMTQTLRHFCELVIEYLEMDMNCHYIHQLKQKELLFLIRYSFSIRELIHFFLPLIGESMSFRNKVHKYYYEGLTIRELANRFNMSDTPFAKMFKREFGLSPYQWMLKQKRNHIMLRLSMPDTKLADIIREFSFTDASHFLKYCKKQFGCTPLELVKQLRDGSMVNQHL